MIRATKKPFNKDLLMNNFSPTNDRVSSSFSMSQPIAYAFAFTGYLRLTFAALAGAGWLRSNLRHDSTKIGNTGSLLT